MPFTAAELAGQMQGEVLGDGSIVLTGFAPAGRAQPGDLTFAENAEYLALAEKSSASAIIVDQSVSTSRKVLIRVANPRLKEGQSNELVKGDVGARHFAFVGQLCESKYTTRGADAIGPTRWVRFANLLRSQFSLARKRGHA